MSDPTAPGNPLDQIIANYLQAAEAGKVPSRQALLDAHPDYADDLRAFFADYDRLDNRADALRLAQTRPPAQRPKVRYLGDFELLEEIAEGGMGLVYKARQESLGRIVALKLVRAGRVAKPIDIARFRIEAEAAAGLDHPNIVPLYEVGEHQGQHYLAMKFIDGPSLAKLPRGSIRTEVTRLEAIARAVDFAHRQGILHRDIKPSNILTDAAGTPYVTDFGLAKRIDAELSLTESGQMLGTAGYIAPEQALGKKGLTVTADVFSLGAVLFERLTGTPAFPGGTILERLRSLHESITPRPTVLMPHLPRDLETVCIKCLEREPGKRYASAGALADDLSRWLRGEPIVARRVTRLERFWLWCRRNPAVAGWACATGVALVAGVAVSWTYAARSVQKERAANEAFLDAKAATEKADAYLAEVRSARRQFARSLIQVIGTRIEDNRMPTEIWAVHELAQRDDDLKMTCLETALSDEALAGQIVSSDESVLQAIVGSSEERRRRALMLAENTVRDAAAKERVRFTAGVIVLHLGNEHSPLPGWTGDRWLAPESDFHWYAQPNVMSKPQMLRLIPRWLRLLHDSRNSSVIGWSAAGLAAASDLAPDGQAIAIRASDTLVALVGKTNDSQVNQAAVQGLAALAPRLDQASAIRASDALIAALGKPNTGSGAEAAGRGLAALAPRLDRLAAIRVSDALIAMIGQSNIWESQTTGPGLAALAPRLDQPAAIRASDSLIAVLGKTNSDAAAQGLAALAPRLDQAAAIRASDALIALLGKRDVIQVSLAAAQGLAALAPRLDQAAAIRASDALIGLLGKPRDILGVNTSQAVGPSLAALAPRLDQAAAIRASDALIGLLGKPRDILGVNTSQAVGPSLAALALRLDGRSALRAFDALITALGKTNDWQANQAAVQGLAALASRLDQRTATRAHEALIDVLHNASGAGAVNAAGQGLTVLAPRLDPPAAMRAFDVLIALPGKTNNAPVALATGRGMAALAPRLDQAAAIRAGDALVGVLGKTTEANALYAAGPGLAALAVRLDAAAAIRASDALITMLANKTAYEVDQAAAADGLAAVAPRLDQPSAIRASDTVGALLGKTDHWQCERSAIQSLAALAPRLDQSAAIRAAESILKSVDNWNDVYEFDLAEVAIIALAQRMGAREGNELRARLGRTAIVGLTRLGKNRELDDTWETRSFAIDQFGPLIERAIATGHQTLTSMDLEIDEYGNMTHFNGGATLCAATTDLATIADCLRHPACVGETRQMVLHRLEELAFPTDAEKQQALAESVVTGLTQPLAGGVLAAGRQAKWERERKFRTMWDAVAWLNKNHPEIDLDKPYKPRK